MLLIGQPKSGSTALMKTIAEIAKIQPINGRNWTAQDVECEGYKETQKYHHTTVKRSKEFLINHAANRKSIYKEHILPIEHHINILKKIEDNFVCLLRDPEEILDCYRRIDSVLNIKFNFKKLYKEIELYYNIYNNLNIQNMLIVTYKDIVLNFKETIKPILNHYGIAIPDDIDKWDLLKVNYTGVGLKRLKDASK